MKADAEEKRAAEAAEATQGRRSVRQAMAKATRYLQRVRHRGMD